MLEPLLDYVTAAKVLGCSPSKVKKMCLAGELKILKVGNETRIRESTLRAWMDHGEHYHEPKTRGESKRSEQIPSGEHTHVY